MGLVRPLDKHRAFGGRPWGTRDFSPRKLFSKTKTASRSNAKTCRRLYCCTRILEPFHACPELRRLDFQQQVLIIPHQQVAMHHNPRSSLYLVQKNQNTHAIHLVFEDRLPPRLQQIISKGRRDIGCRDFLAAI